MALRLILLLPFIQFIQSLVIELDSTTSSLQNASPFSTSLASDFITTAIPTTASASQPEATISTTNDVTSCCQTSSDASSQSSLTESTFLASSSTDSISTEDTQSLTASATHEPLSTTTSIEILKSETQFVTSSELTSFSETSDPIQSSTIPETKIPEPTETLLSSAVPQTSDPIQSSTIPETKIPEPTEISKESRESTTLLTSTLNDHPQPLTLTEPKTQTTEPQPTSTSPTNQIVQNNKIIPQQDTQGNNQDTSQNSPPEANGIPTKPDQEGGDIQPHQGQAGPHSLSSNAGQTGVSRAASIGLLSCSAAVVLAVACVAYRYRKTITTACKYNSLPSVGNEGCDEEANLVEVRDLDGRLSHLSFVAESWIESRISSYPSSFQSSNV